MITKVMEWAVATWQSGQIGMFKVFLAGCSVYVCLMFLVVLIIGIATCIDNAYAQQYEGTGMVVRKYLKIETDNGCYEVEDSKEIRKMNVRFMVVIRNKEGVEFKTRIFDEKFFDRIPEGFSIPTVIYLKKRLTRRVCIIGLELTSQDPTEGVSTKV